MSNTVEEYAAAQAVEYGTYVAVGPITVDGVLAYNEGHPVPVSNVEKFDYLKQGLVRKVTPDAAVPAAKTPTK